MVLRRGPRGPCLSGLVVPDLAAPDGVFKFHSGGHSKAPQGFDGHPGRTSRTLGIEKITSNMKSLEKNDSNL